MGCDRGETWGLAFDEPWASVCQRASVEECYEVVRLQRHLRPGLSCMMVMIRHRQGVGWVHCSGSDVQHVSGCPRAIQGPRGSLVEELPRRLCHDRDRSPRLNSLAGTVRLCRGSLLHCCRVKRCLVMRHDATTSTDCFLSTMCHTANQHLLHGMSSAEQC
jgi:hypothetical protein